MNKIGIIYTTFLRDELMKITVNSIIEYMPKDSILYIGDQGNKTIEKDTFYNSLPKNIVKVIYLPYDCGLSYARNTLICYANSQGCDYSLITADSIAFEEKFNLNEIIEFLSHDNNRALVGFNLKNRISWEYDLKLVPNEHFELSKPKESPIIYKGIKFQPVGICKNFFLAKTKVLLECKWDEELKLAEHEVFFYNLQNKGFKAYYTEDLKAYYINNKGLEYNLKRRRIYTIYLDLMKKKYNIKGWTKTVK